MNKRALNAHEAIASLQRVPGVRIIGNEIRIPIDSTALGNKSWGKIDGLRNYHGYIVVYYKD